jgi:hypothetical protein
MLYFQRGSKTDVLTSEDLRIGLFEALYYLRKKKKVLIIPPDFTRYHSRSGELTEFAWEYYKELLTDILPALRLWAFKERFK